MVDSFSYEDVLEPDGKYVLRFVQLYFTLVPGGAQCLRKKTTEKISVSLPIQVVSILRRQAKEEHVPLSKIVARACQQYTENLRDYARDGALFSRASFYAMCEVVAVARKENPGDAQRRFLAKASRLLARRKDVEFELDDEGEI